MLRSKLGTMATGLHGTLDQIGTKGAHAIEARAKQTIVEKHIVDTGATLNSVAVTPAGDLAWKIGPTTSYAPFLEYGHHTRSGSFVAARPFMVPSLEQERPGILDALAAAIEREGTL